MSTLDLSSRYNIADAKKRIEKMTTKNDIGAFILHEKREAVKQAAKDRITALAVDSKAGTSDAQKAEGKLKVEDETPSEKVVAVTEGGAQPLDNTSRPLTKKEAKQVADERAAARPFQPPPPPINPPMPQSKDARARTIAKKLIAAAARVINTKIDDIMEGFDDAFDLSGNDEKFTHRIGASFRIIRQAKGKSYTAACKLRMQVVDEFECEENFRLEDPQNDIVDRAEAIAAGTAPPINDPPASPAKIEGAAPAPPPSDPAMAKLPDADLEAIASNKSKDQTPEAMQAASDELDRRKREAKAAKKSAGKGLVMQGQPGHA